jgi:virginiamycin B lyase
VRGVGSLLTAVVALLALAAPARAALTPTITEHVLPPSSHPVGLEAGPDGALWITQWSSNGIARMTTAGVTSPYSLPSAGTQPQAITTGPDGNLWATESQGNAIVRVTPTGVTTEYLLPTASSGPAGIVAGPDGNLWFTEATGARIGRIAPSSGTISEITLASGAQPSGIAVGADGNLWVALAGANAIARVTPSGTVSAFPVPTASSAPLDVAAGPDGNVWFVERNAGRIGRITPAGTITELPLASASSAPTTIAAGPDGALWLGELTGNAIGRITTTGAVEEYPLAAGAQPGDIAVGPDGNVWVTESARDAVARITTPPAIGTATAAVKGTSQVDLAVGISAHAQQTTVSLEYGTTTGYGSTTPVRVFNSLSTAPVAQSWSITGLAPGTTYHLRVVATNATGTARGADMVATTVAGPAAPGPTAPIKGSPGAAPATIITSPLTAPALGPTSKAPPAARLVGATTVRVVAGRAPMVVSCPASDVGGCRGTIVLRPPASTKTKTKTKTTKTKTKATKKTGATASRCARGCRPLGEGKFDIKAGKRRSVAVKLSATGRGAVAKASKVKARATVTTVVDGKSRTTSRTVTLRARG